MSQTNKHHALYLEEMGITPVWQRRASALSDPMKPATLPVSPDVEITVSEAPVKTKPSLETWDELIQAIQGCTLCNLSTTRCKTVPGTGDRNANWLFIGEGPGYYEDQQGEPFVGRSGKLLDNMMNAIGLQRSHNAYITNIVKCRATDAGGKDRPPGLTETGTCLAYLERQIEMINPEVIITLGKTAAVTLLDVSPDVALGKLREKVHYYMRGEKKIPLIVTYHPAYLLRTPTGKKQAWSDLCLALETQAEITREAE